MGIFGRMKTLLKANLNDLTSRAENPERVLNQLILDMQDQLRQAKLEVRDTIADRKRLEKKIDAAREKAKDWERKARTAVKAGRDDLAKEALTRKHEQDELVAEYQASWEKQKANSEKLAAALKNLDSKIEDAKRRKSILLAKKARVDTQNSLSGTAKAASDASAFDDFERQAGKIDDFEAEVEAHAELSEDAGNEELEAKFTELEGGDAADDALAALKQKMEHEDS